jgi:translation initiation factor IF-2
MRVLELARDLNVSPETLVQLLRELRIAVQGQGSVLKDADVARVIARVERERRAGKAGTEAVKAVIEDAQAAPRRRRRRREDVESSPEEVEEETAEAKTPPPAPAAEEREAAVVAEAPAPEESAPPAPVEETPAVAPPTPREPVVEELPPAAVAPPSVRPTPAPGRVPPVPPRSARPPERERPAAAETPRRERPAPSERRPQETPPAAAAGGTPPPEAAKPARGLEPVRGYMPPAAASAAPGGTVRVQAEGYTADGQKKAKGKKGKKRARVDQGAVQDNIQRVMAEIKGGGKKRRKGRMSPQDLRDEREAKEEVARQEREKESRTVRVTEFLTVKELSELIDVSSTQIITSAFKNMGLMVTINQRLDFDQIELLLDEFGFQAAREEEYAGLEEELEVAEDLPEDLVPRPPVVTVMGHVDHGKTRLLDAIRNTNVVAGESGGITQHIGAYHVELPDGRSVTFLDTPGHAAFTAMRARGADITDLVILVVAADDSVMPQTIEAISHAKNAGVPLVVAVNKVDLPSANPGKVKQELLQHGVTVEDFGGDVLVSDISAKQGIGIEELLEKVLLQAEILELKANPGPSASGTVIEAKLDVGKGPVVSILVQRGTLRVGDSFLMGMYDGRVRAMLDERGKPVQSAGPGIPVQILGSPGVPQAGDSFQAMDAVRAAEIAQARQRLEREKQLRVKERGIKLGDFSKLLSEGQTDTLPLIIKGDVDGSVQAVSDSLQQLGSDEVRVQVIHRGVGAINESDVLLAATAGAIIIGFRVRPDTGARMIAERDGVDIHLYDVIYEAVDDIRAALEGMLSPEKREKISGTAEVREVFRITRVGSIAGCYVTQGTIERSAQVRLVREGVVIYSGGISSLKRFKDDVREVREGYECGIGITNYNDLKVGDVIECFSVEEVARTLAGSAQQGRGG